MINNQIILLEMTDGQTVNGVSRYIEMFLLGTQKYNLNIVYLKFIKYKSVILPKILNQKYYKEIQIPLPCNLSTILNEQYWNKDYINTTYNIIKNEITQGCILHIHTMNLIGFARYVKKQKNATIIAHIHCIPWKYLFKYDLKKFNCIYSEIYQNQKGANKYNFISKEEKEISKYADSIICVTRDAAMFFQKHLRTPSSKLFLVYNGLHECSSSMKPYKKSDTIRLLFVGQISKSKGIIPILEMLGVLVKEGVQAKLTLVGAEDKEICTLLDTKYSYYNIKRFGQVQYEQLIKLYQENDIGLIPSFFEQCSYTAIEMMMFGLPVIFANHDGLKEIFTKKVAIPLNITFSESLGLTINVYEFANIIKLLKEKPSKINFYKRKIREHYSKRFNLDSMISKTLNIYKKIHAHETPRD